jgi:hypothetical protein
MRPEDGERIQRFPAGRGFRETGAAREGALGAALKKLRLKFRPSTQDE